ncbi:MAG: hypothetical protein OEL76_15605 [Siculibacillus sp.]|nr:hypothetical protein [Siculibacillus sp.]
MSDVLRSAVDLFVLAPTHERAEIRAFADLIAGLLPDAGLVDRVHVAARLAHRADTPPVIARMLAADTVEVARPVVLRSPVLTSSDLVETMRRGPDHVELVAERLDLTSDVVLALGRPAEPTAGASRNGAAPAVEPLGAMHFEAIIERAAAARPIGDADAEAEVALHRALDELAAEFADEDDAFSEGRALSIADAEAEDALQHALDRLAAELDAEAHEREAEAAAAAALRQAGPTVPADIDLFLSHDSAGRWRFVQEHSSNAAIAPAPPRRRRSDDPAVIGARFFSVLVAGDRERLADDLCRTARLERPVVERILTDRQGEAFAITLAALGIDERTATSILLLHSGERATLSHMQDLAAMAGRIGWRTAENIVEVWRGGRGLGKAERVPVLDAAERRGVGRQEATTGDRVTGGDEAVLLGGTGR